MFRRWGIAPILLIATLLGSCQADYPCQGNFTWWPGPGDEPWLGYCISYSDDPILDGPGAIAYCAGILDGKYFSPSIHSQQDLDYWSRMAVDLGIAHFWLGLNCPFPSDPYTWTNGNRTNYFGPNKELLKCDKIHGYHIHEEGFVQFAIVDDHTDTDSSNFSPAPGLCSYLEFSQEYYDSFATTVPGEGGGSTSTTTVKTTTPKTTNAPTTTPRATTTTTEAWPTPYSPPLPDLNTQYCTCDVRTLYLDLVVVIDNSADMTLESLGAAISAMQSVLLPGANASSLGDQMFQLQVAVVSFANDVVIVKNFGEIKTVQDVIMIDIPHSMTKATQMTSAIKTATGLISSRARDFTRGAIVLLSNSYNQLDEANIIEASAAFQDNGGIMITVDYSIKGDLAGLKRIASTGYYMNRNMYDFDDFNAEILYALCDANCFCSNGLTPYDTANDRGTPLGCYHVADSSAVFEMADLNCKNEGGFVATVHDTAKNFFMISTLFDGNRKFWLGYKRNNGQFTWEDNSLNSYTNWAASNPTAQNCTFAKKTTGFNSQWYSADCLDPINAAHEYACQLRPCDSTYNCWPNLK